MIGNTVPTPNMMWWVYLPVIMAAAVLMILPLAFYLLGRTQTVGLASLTEEEQTIVDYLRGLLIADGWYDDEESTEIIAERGHLSLIRPCSNRHRGY